MSVEYIYFISRTSPTIGRSTFAGVGGGLFGLYKEKKYMSALQDALKSVEIDWIVESDNTEADIEKLMVQNAKLLVCAPGLRFQFYSNGFDKKNIIHLSMMDYVSNNFKPIIKRIKEICNEK